MVKETQTSGEEGQRASASVESASPDQRLAAAVELAQDSLAPIAHLEEIGAYLGCKAEGERLVTHEFTCLKPGYPGWKWVSTLSRIPHSKVITVCEIDLLPGPEALLSPPWNSGNTKS